MDKRDRDVGQFESGSERSQDQDIGNRTVSRRALLSAGALAGGAALTSWANPSSGSGGDAVSIERSGDPGEDHDVAGASISELQSLMSAGRLSATELVEIYLHRINAIDVGLDVRAVMQLNPDARRIAAQLDQERFRGHIRGPLHGIPVLLKDNIDTADRTQTTAGSLVRSP